jgi:cytochrome P450 / NADPH-cytochrome P450 reductase
MVGAGTGVAPFRGFLQERADFKEKGVPIGESILFFGCRNVGNDFLYADELQGFADSRVTDLPGRLSRADGQPRTYVQDLIEREQDHVWDLLAAGAVIYICGNSHTMAPRGPRRADQDPPEQDERIRGSGSALAGRPQSK